MIQCDLLIISLNQEKVLRRGTTQERFRTTTQVICNGTLTPKEG